MNPSKTSRVFNQKPAIVDKKIKHRTSTVSSPTHQQQKSSDESDLADADLGDDVQIHEISSSCESMRSEGAETNGPEKLGGASASQEVGKETFTRKRGRLPMTSKIAIPISSPSLTVVPRLRSNKDLSTGQLVGVLRSRITNKNLVKKKVQSQDSRKKGTVASVKPLPMELVMRGKTKTDPKAWRLAKPCRSNMQVAVNRKRSRQEGSKTSPEGTPSVASQPILRNPRLLPRVFAAEIRAKRKAKANNETKEHESFQLAVPGISDMLKSTPNQTPVELARLGSPPRSLPQDATRLVVRSTKPQGASTTATQSRKRTARQSDKVDDETVSPAKIVKESTESRSLRKISSAPLNPSQKDSPSVTSRLRSGQGGNAMTTTTNDSSLADIESKGSATGAETKENGSKRQKIAEQVESRSTRGMLSKGTNEPAKTMENLSQPKISKLPGSSGMTESSSAPPGDGAVGSAKVVKPKSSGPVDPPEVLDSMESPTTPKRNRPKRGDGALDIALKQKNTESSASASQEAPKLVFERLIVKKKSGEAKVRKSLCCIRIKTTKIMIDILFHVCLKI